MLDRFCECRAIRGANSSLQPMPHGRLEKLGLAKVHRRDLRLHRHRIWEQLGERAGNAAVQAASLGA